MQEILTKEAASQGLQRLAAEIVDRLSGAEELALVGIRREGAPIAVHLASLIEKNTGIQVPIGAVDITLYRDDAPAPLPNPRIGKSDVPFDVRSKKIVLVDDVLYTGRTVRAAMHALLDYGRSRAILLAVLVDRGGRELPIQPDFVVMSTEVSATEQVEVQASNDGFRAIVVGG
ncbi:MAG TPA: bifunctional pyr operon transcriptional regulator/uracil phosphoribosyltransferase PyrR [Polyangiaceae bacterium]|nr:bifunctional pyr operon transcriptional regulator/uracil phosphoribosyltransferase PyrR [Polyangiaceae bacterium]